MDFSLAFLSSPFFYVLLVLGALAMLPRALYTARRMNAPTPLAMEQIQPTLAQRVSLFIPGVCVFACIVLFGSASGAVALLVVFMAVYIGLILFLKGPSAR